MDFARGHILPLAIGGALVLLIAGAVYFFYTPQQQDNAVSETAPVSASTTTDTIDVSAEVGGAVETPADKLPETNPFSDYKNPFE